MTPHHHVLPPTINTGMQIANQALAAALDDCHACQAEHIYAMTMHDERPNVAALVALLACWSAEQVMEEDVTPMDQALTGAVKTLEIFQNLSAETLQVIRSLKVQEDKISMTECMEILASIGQAGRTQVCRDALDVLAPAAKEASGH